MGRGVRCARRMGVVMRTMDDQLRRRDNYYAPGVARFENATDGMWHEPSQASLPWRRPLSVVVPAHDCAHSILPVLDALAASKTADSFEIVVIDDCSDDGTAELAASHSIEPCVVRLHRRSGAGVARNA